MYILFTTSHYWCYHEPDLECLKLIIIGLSLIAQDLPRVLYVIKVL